MLFLNLLTFVIIYFLLFVSVSGWGILLSKILKINELNFPLSLLLGIIFLTFISYVTIFFIAHYAIFNVLLHLLGLLFFIKNKRIFKIEKNYYFIILVISIALIISKTHDDFSFYHFQQALNFASNKFQIGLANLDFSYAHNSSLLLLSSLFYLPVIKYYLFNAPNLIFYSSLILLFYHELTKISAKIELYKVEFFFLLITLIYCLVKFSRLSEFGTDLVGQILVFYLFFLFLNIQTINKNFYLIHIILIFLVTLKTYFIFYFLFVTIIIFQLGFKPYFMKIFQEKKIFLFMLIFVFTFYATNFLTSGCLIYPIPQLCFENFSWALSINEIKEYNIWYEKWAKGIAGANYVLNDSNIILKNFNWVNNWFNNYFFNKVFDNILTILLIVLLIYLAIRNLNYHLNNKKFFLKKYYFKLYLLVIFILIFWFFKHPTLRYGGYAPLFIFLTFPLIIFYSRFKIKKSIYKFSSLLIIFAFTFFTGKNFLRIYEEFNRSDFYKFTDFPYYKIDKKVKFERVSLAENIFVSYPIKEICWTSPPPCSKTKNIKAKSKYNFIIFEKKREK